MSALQEYFDSSHQLVRDSVRRFIEREVLPHIADWEEAEEFPRELYRKAGAAGILGIGAVRRRPWEYEGEIALRDVMTLSLSFDHRLVDGEQGARFLAAVGDVLREPGRAMLLV